MARLIIAAIAAALLGGCASTPPQGSTNVNAANTTCDRERMERVERAALHPRSDVLWVNCPQRRAAL